MSKRDDLIVKYAADLKDKCGVNPDMDLLTKVTVGLGPSIYNADSSTVSGSDEKELATVKNNFLIFHTKNPYDLMENGIVSYKNTRKTKNSI